MKKFILIAVKIALTAAALFVGVLTLQKFEYLSQFNQIDNVVGMITVLLVFVFSQELHTYCGQGTNEGILL